MTRDELLEFINSCSTEQLQDLFNRQDSRIALILRARVTMTDELNEIVNGTIA